MATNIYGIAIRKTIPSFTASTLALSPVLSREALHIAHCADEVKEKIKNKRTNQLPLEKVSGL